MWVFLETWKVKSIFFLNMRTSLHQALQSVQVQGKGDALSDYQKAAYYTPFQQQN